MKKINWRTVVGVFVYAVLFASIIYSVIKIITVPEISTSNVEGEHIRSDYILMLIQCVLGLVVIGIPAILEKRFSFMLPNGMSIAYFIFLYCAIYLGEVRQFYYLIPHWDDILHCFSSGMLGAFGFSLVSILNDSDKVSINLNPCFVALFAFCFALTAGAIWEVYEFSGDVIFGLNMQKYRLADGTLLIGSMALRDTMFDIIIDGIGAFIVSAIGFLSLKKKGRENTYEKN